MAQCEMGNHKYTLSEEEAARQAEVERLRKLLQETEEEKAREDLKRQLDALNPRSLN